MAITPITGIGTGSGGGGVTSVGATSPVASSGGTTPTISMAAATSGNAGHMTAAQAGKVALLSGTNTGDQTSIVGITGTKAEFDTAVTDGNFLYSGDITQYTDELAQDAVGAMVDSTLVYTDGTPLLSRAALTGEATASAGSNAMTLTNSAVIGKVLTGYTSGAGTVAATDSILQAIQKLNGNDAATLTAAQSYTDGLVTGLLDFKGSTDASGNPNYPSALKGDAYYISVAGKIGGASGTVVEVGDLYIASADNAGGAQAGVGGSWFVLEHNLVGALVSSNNLSDLTSTSAARTNIGLGNVDNTSDANKPISVADMAAHSTGLKTGGVLSIGVGGAGVATTFTIASGVGLIVDNTLSTATLSTVTFGAKTNVAVTNIGTQPLTFVAIDSSGNVVQQATDFTSEQHRLYIVIGSIIHTNLTTVTAVNQGQHLAISPISQLNDLVQALAGFNVSGNVVTANGANLNINKSAGELFKQGANYATSANKPNVVSLGSLTAASFRYNNQTGAAGASIIAIDPNNYDLAGVTTAVTANRFTIQRIFLFSSNLLAIQRGQAIYSTLADAKAAIQTETFLVNSAISPNSVLRAFLIVKQGTTNLSSATDAFFLEAPKFGGTAGVGGLSVTSLQGAYDNSITPEIVTNSTNGAVTFKRGSAADTDLVIEGQNAAGTTTFSVKGDGSTYAENLGVGQSTPTAVLHLKAGTAAASTAPIKFTSGTKLTTPEDGALEFDGTNFHQTIGSTRFGVGYLNVPQNAQSAAYTTVLGDAGKSVDHPSTDANARIFTIDSNANVAYPVGTCISFSNMTSNVVTIAITSDTMYLAGTGTTGSRSLAQYGVATARKLTSTTWIISGVGLT